MNTRDYLLPIQEGARIFRADANRTFRSEPPWRNDGKVMAGG